MCFETSWEQKSETINARNKTRTVLESSLISAQIHEDIFFQYSSSFSDESSENNNKKLL